MSVPEICMSVGLPSTVGDGEVLEGDRRRGLESIADCLLERRPLSSGGAWRDGAQGAAARLLDDHALARHHDAALDDRDGGGEHRLGVIRGIVQDDVGVGPRREVSLALEAERARLTREYTLE